jgi:hypothetical protein
LLRHVPENIYNPRVVTGKWLAKNSTLTTKIKNKYWTLEGSVYTVATADTNHSMSYSA